MADGGAQKRPLDDPEDANGGALVAVKKARQEDSLVVASKRPEIKAVSCRHGGSTARRLAARPCTAGAAGGGGNGLDACASPLGLGCCLCRDQTGQARCRLPSCC